MNNWQPIETAPKDGTKIWGWLYDIGIVLMHWMSAEANAAEAGDDNPDEYISCWVKSGDPSDGDWSPKFWLPFDTVGIPPGVEWVEELGRFRDQREPPAERVMDWLKDQGATEMRKFDEDTGAPVRVFSIKL